MFPRTVGKLTVVMHDSQCVAAGGEPADARLIWALTAPAARRYVAGSVGRNELHVLAPAALARPRLAASPARAQMLALAPASLYTRRVIIECNHELHDAQRRRRDSRGLRWAWVLEGGARWFSGETAQARGAIGDGCTRAAGRSFPPGVRDAPLLGGTVIDMIAREHGELAAAQFVTRLHPQGPAPRCARRSAARSSTSRGRGDRTSLAWRAPAELEAEPQIAKHVGCILVQRGEVIVGDRRKRLQQHRGAIEFPGRGGRAAYQGERPEDPVSGEHHIVASRQ